MKPKYLALDALRGVAAFAVAVSHAGIVLSDWGAIENAGLAVDFFFMLSGFVLAHAYGERLASLGFWYYLRARIVRLFPLIVLGTLVGVAPYIFFSGKDLAYLARLTFQGIALIPEPLKSFEPSMFPLDPPAWSLFHEMIASILFGLGVWRGRLLWLPIGAASAALVWLILSRVTLNIGFAFDDLHFGLIRVCFSFGVGVALYQLKDLLKVPALPLWALSCLLLAALMTPVSPVAFLVFVSFVLFPLIILSAARTETRHLQLAKLSGDLSYPLYILHWPIYVCVLTAATASGLEINPILLVLVGLTAAVIGSSVALQFYDFPMRRFLTNRLNSGILTEAVEQRRTR